MSKRAIVVGAGPGGLATALLLAKAGLEVDVLERTDRVGGRTSAFEAQGFRFDLGPTFFLFPEVLEEIFAAVGSDLRSEVELVRLDPQYRLVFGAGGVLDATPDPAAMRAAIAALCPADAPHFDRFLAENRAKFAQFKPCLQSPYLSWRDVVSARMLSMLPLLRPWNSVDDELRRYFQDPRIRLAFTFQSKYLGMSPFRCPGLFSILSFLEYEFGVFHPIGGCSAITDAMARVAERLGVRIHLNEEVERIRFKGRRAVGVETAAGAYRADAIVVNADFASAMAQLVPDGLRRRWTNARIAGKKFSCSTFMLYLGIEGTHDDLPHHSIYLARDYLSNLADIEDRHVLSEDPSVYVQNACVTDPGLAPRGMSTLYVLAPVTHQHPNVDWAAERRAFRARVLGQLPRLGFEDVERRIRFERIITPDDWERNAHIYRGATFNLAHNLGQMLHLRPRNRFEDVDGIYLTGGGTHPGSGLPVIFESARITARLIGEDHGVSVAVSGRPARAPARVASGLECPA
jgi:phytoene desaturase